MARALPTALAFATLFGAFLSPSPPASAAPLPTSDAQLCAVIEAVVNRKGADQIGQAACLKTARDAEGRLPVLIRTVTETAGKSTPKDIGTPGHTCGTAFVLAPRTATAGTPPKSDVLVYIEVGQIKRTVRYYAWAGERATVTAGDAATGAPCAADSGTLTRSGTAWKAKGDTDSK